MIYTLRIRKTDKWSGVQGYANTSKGIQPAISTKTRRLNLGPLSSMEPSKKDGFKTLGEERRYEFERELGLDKGALTDLVERNGKLVSDYWKEYNLEVPVDGVTLDTENILDKLAVIICKASGLVTNGKNIRSAKAKFEIFSDEEISVSTNDRREELMKAFSYMEDMSPEDLYDYVISKGYRPANTSPQVVRRIVGDDVEGNPKAFNEWVNHDYYKKKVELYKMVNAGIIKKVANRFVYNEVSIGIDDLSAIAYLQNPAYQKVTNGIYDAYDYYLKNKGIVEVETQLEGKEPISEADVEAKAKTPPPKSPTKK